MVILTLEFLKTCGNLVGMGCIPPLASRIWQLLHRPLPSAVLLGACLNQLRQRWDRSFSEHSYGFRPGRSAHQAVAGVQRYIAEGRHWVVDIDLEQFFDRCTELLQQPLSLCQHP